MQVLDLSGEAAPTSGVQEWARERRYSWFSSFLSEVDCLALAHHRGDLAGNILFRLTRGVSDRLCGMEGRRGVTWRPLLSYSRDEISESVSRQKVHIVRIPRMLRSYIVTQPNPASGHA